MNSSTCHIVDNGQIKFVQLVDNVLEENESICNEATGKQLEIQSNKNSHSEQSHCWVFYLSCFVLFIHSIYLCLM